MAEANKLKTEKEVIEGVILDLEKGNPGGICCIIVNIYYGKLNYDGLDAGAHTETFYKKADKKIARLMLKLWTFLVKNNSQYYGIMTEHARRRAHSVLKKAPTLGYWFYCNKDRIEFLKHYLKDSF